MKKVAGLGWYLLVCISAFNTSLVAQDTSEPRQINGGVLNGKAISLPKPQFPAAARAVGASGPVTVQVLIDVNGDVISASAVSGHPLLRNAAAEAARAAKFSPTLLSGIPVKVMGVITYNFVGALQLSRVAFILAHAEQTSLFGAYSAPASLAYQLPADWIQERELLNSLTFEETPKAVESVPVIRQAGPPPPPAPADKDRYTVRGDVSFSVADSPPIYGARKLDPRSVGTVRNISALVEARAAANERSAWVYDVGTALGKLVADRDDKIKLQSHCESIESLANRAPSDVVLHSFGQLKEFVDLCQRESAAGDKQSVVMKAEMLSNLRY